MAKRPGMIRIEFQIRETDPAGIELKRQAQLFDIPESTLCRGIVVQKLNQIYQKTHGGETQEAEDLLLQGNASSPRVKETPASPPEQVDEGGMAAILAAIQLDNEEEE